MTPPLAPRIAGRLRAASLAVLISAGASSAGAEPGGAPCNLPVLGTGVVAAVLDGASFTLDDGRQVRLAAIEAPRPPADKADARDGAGRAAKAALEALVKNRTVTLKRLGGETDRYGRLVAYAVVNRDGIEIPVQPALLAQGQARVGARIGERGCVAGLMAAERAARGAKLGLWADPYYQVRRAGNPAEILADRGRFTVVEGRVVSVRNSGGTIYMNFGRFWTRDFTVTIARRKERAFAAAGLAPKDFAGRTVRVRGWVEQRGGPLIEAAAPEQIEIADEK